MKIEELVVYLNNQVNDLCNKQGLAIQVGDLQAISDLEEQIQETREVIAKLEN